MIDVRNPIAAALRDIRDVLTSPNVSDSNYESANLVDVIHFVSRALWGVTHSITAQGAPGRDAIGGSVTSLTESVMGVTAGLVSIAASLDAVAEAIRSTHE
jgi:hypothetical protein